MHRDPSVNREEMDCQTLNLLSNFKSYLIFNYGNALAMVGRKHIVNESGLPTTQEACKSGIDSLSL
jgi:hypothetical protein